MKFSFYIWSLYLILFPFYLFSEGNPQLADFFGTLLIILNGKSIMQNFTSSIFTKYLLYFVYYSFLVNTAFMLVIGDYYIFKSSIFYLYCFLFMMAVLHQLQHKGFLKFTIVAIFISQLTQLVVWQVIPDQGVRFELLFNNPNQLALWGLCVIIIVNGIYSITKENFYLTLGISLLATFFILLSASRSATVCSLAFWLFFFLKSKKNLILMSSVSFILLFVAFLSGSLRLDHLTQINYIYGRIATAGASDGGLGERGFDRIIEFPKYIFFGAGEGFPSRFNTKMELHSTFLNLIFSYGIIGFFLYVRAIITLLANSYLDIIILFLILSIFANVHMTLRIPLFWIALGILFYAKNYNNDLKDDEIITKNIQ